MGKKIPSRSKSTTKPTKHRPAKSWDLKQKPTPRIGVEAQTYLHQHTIDDSNDGKAHGDFVNQKENHEPLLSLESVL